MPTMAKMAKMALLGRAWVAIAVLSIAGAQNLQEGQAEVDWYFFDVGDDAPAGKLVSVPLAYYRSTRQRSSDETAMSAHAAHAAHAAQEKSSSGSVDGAGSAGRCYHRALATMGVCAPLGDCLWAQHQVRHHGRTETCADGRLVCCPYTDESIVYPSWNPYTYQYQPQQCPHPDHDDVPYSAYWDKPLPLLPPQGEPYHQPAREQYQPYPRPPPQPQPQPLYPVKPSSQYPSETPEAPYSMQAPYQPPQPVSPYQPPQPMSPYQPPQPMSPYQPPQPVSPYQPPQPMSPYQPPQPVSPYQPPQAPQPARPVRPPMRPPMSSPMSSPMRPSMQPMGPAQPPQGSPDALVPHIDEEVPTTVSTPKRERGAIARKMCVVYEKFAPTVRFGPDKDCVPNHTYPIGGNPALPREFPHMAQLGIGPRNDIQWFCGGSLIAPKWILTAAHCVFNGDSKVEWVRLGDLEPDSDTDDSNPQIIRVAEVVKHPDYKAQQVYNDIALLRLASEPDMSTPHVRPACLQVDKKLKKEKLNLIGFGLTEENGVPAKALMEVALWRTPGEKCEKFFEGQVNLRQLPDGLLDDSQLCAGLDQVGKDACQGDSGGPLNTPYSPTCMLNVAGVTSFGQGCGRGAPGVYTRVSHFVPWIESIVWPDEQP